MKFLGKRTDGFREERDFVHPDRNFTEFGPENMPGYTNKVSPFDELVEKFKCLIPEIRLSDVKLDFVVLIPEIGKDCFAMIADNIKTPGCRNTFLTFIMGDFRKRSPYFCYCVLPVECGRIEVNTF